MQKALLLVLVCATLGAFAAPVPYKNCAKPGATLTVTTVDANPYPFKKGVPLNIALNGTLSKPVTAGKFALDVKFMGVHVFGQTGDLCKWSPSFTCPASGAVSISMTQAIPGVSPSGQYSITVTAVDQDNQQITCVDLQAQITAQ